MMRTRTIFTKEPPAQVANTAEVYAIAFAQAEASARRYGELSTNGDAAFESVRSVFAILEQRELHRARGISATCVDTLSRFPDRPDIRWTLADPVPAEELSEFANSSLSTPYGAWALAVRHRERGFAFWTYVAALANDDAVRRTAEDMARNALQDVSELRQERRLAWRGAHRPRAGHEPPSGNGDVARAARLEGLLLNDILQWAQDAPAALRARLLAIAGNAEATSKSDDLPDELPPATTHAEIAQRALRLAEQLAVIYLDEADRADDQARLDLAQRLAGRAITRLAGLRSMAAMNFG